LVSVRTLLRIGLAGRLIDGNARSFQLSQFFAHPYGSNDSAGYCGKQPKPVRQTDQRRELLGGTRCASKNREGSNNRNLEASYFFSEPILGKHPFRENSVRVSKHPDTCKSEGNKNQHGNEQLAYAL